MSSSDQSVNYNSESTGNYEIDRKISCHYKNNSKFLSKVSHSKQSNHNQPYIKETRKDKFGKQISRKNKEHKISFADRIEKPGRDFIQIHEVKSIKQFYNITRVDVDGKQCFGCCIF